MLVIAVAAHSQGTYKISLSNISIDPAGSFKVNRVIDGRKNKVDIGRVQPNGWKARPKIAILDQPLERAMQDLLMQSYLTSTTADGFIMRVTRVAISEVKTKKNMSKTALAEVAFDVFRMRGIDSCYYAGSTIGRAEETGWDVSQRHSENIGHALEDAIRHLVIKQPDSPQHFAIADLDQENFSFRDADNVPVLIEEQHPDGVFISYDEFLSNKPSITSGYEVEIGSTVKLFRLDEGGKKEQVSEGVYALCKNNELYVQFNKKFYLLQRRSGSFHFIGPALVDPTGRRTWILFGATGVALESALKSVKIHYRIDLDSGGFVEMSVVR